MANEVSIWNKVMSSAMTVPGVKVDRESFLRKEFSLYCSAEQLDKVISIRPSEVLSKNIIDRVANSCINIWGIERSGFFNGQGKWAKALKTKWFRHVRENGLNISKRFFPLHGLTSALRLRGFSADLRVIALHRACRWG